MSSPPRILTATFSHESSTFTPVSTTWESFTQQRFGYLRGQEVLDRFAGTRTAVGGFIDGAAQHGFVLIPTVFAEAHPSGPAPRDVFDAILDDILTRMRAAGPVDGVLLDLHGSMVAEGVDDGEGHILEAVRQVVGDVPILGQLDIHANVSHRMVEQADVLLGHETYPEIDMYERSLDLAAILDRILRHGLHPTMALHQLPMIWGLNQVTAHPPMQQAIAQLHRIRDLPGVVCGSIATCFSLADVPDLGASVYIVTDDDRARAQQLADELGAWIFARKEQWHAPRPSTRQALEQAEAAGAFPAIFADPWDNTGGGAPGDSTGMLQAFVDAELRDACILYMVDPQAVAACHAAGAGGRLELAVGGKASPLQGAPVAMDAEVVAISDGAFQYSGPRNHGMTGSMGPSAHIRQDGIHVLLVTEREQPFDTAFALTLGLDPAVMRYIGVKSAVHFRAGFESWSGAIYTVSEPSAQNPDSGQLEYPRRGRKVYPLDDV